MRTKKSNVLTCAKCSEEFSFFVVADCPFCAHENRPLSLDKLKEIYEKYDPVGDRQYNFESYIFSTLAEKDWWTSLQYDPYAKRHWACRIRFYELGTFYGETALEAILKAFITALADEQKRQNQPPPEVLF